VRQSNRERHERRSLIRGVPEHHALVPRSTRIDSHADVRGLFVDGCQDGARLPVKRIYRVRIAYLTNGVAHDVGDVHVRIGGDLPGDQRQPRGNERLARNARFRILRQDGIQNRIRYLVCDFVRMPLGYGLG
jgi:hypothetical protein